jgi:hypothetical protein
MFFSEEPFGSDTSHSPLSKGGNPHALKLVQLAILGPRAVTEFNIFTC